ncbi:MAG TPA: phage holin family protein [Myxococcota bacterium]|nr:phage holin family protein [Myxococcota bacterium]
MRRTLIRLLVSILSLGVAARVVDGLDFPGNPPGIGQVVGVALLFGLLNTLVKPLLQLVSCGLYLVTLGLVHFVINAAVLQLTGWLAPGWLHVAGFWPAFWGGIVTSAVSTLLLALLDPEPRRVVERTVVHTSPQGEVIEAEYEAVQDERGR